MHRRALLATLASTFVSGCVGGQDGTVGGSPDAPEDSTPGAPRPDVAVGGAELVTRPLGDGVQAGAVAEVRNDGDVYLGLVSITAEFYAADGTLLESRPWDVRALAPGETWRPYVAATPAPEEIDRAAVVVSNVQRLERARSPDGLQLQDVELRVPERGHPRVLGVVENAAGSPRYTEARAKLYDGSGRLLATGFDAAQQLRSGQAWSFDVRVPLQHEGRADEIADHSVVVTS